MKNILLYIWQLPQNILGLVFCLFFKAEKKLYYRGKTIRVNSKLLGGLSLGDYVFVKRYPYNNKTWNVVKHEYGHSIQSKYLGWFYLIVVGLPSLIWAICYKGKEEGYYTGFYTESWANKLGNV